MPNLCIIPFRALKDERIANADLRILLAIGAHTDRHGAGVWASAKTLSSEALLSRSQFFVSAARLEEYGYITRTERYSVTGTQLTSMLRVLLDEPKGATEGGEGPVILDGEGPDVLDGKGPVATGHKRPQQQRPQEQPPAQRKISTEDQGVAQRLFKDYPARDGDNSYIAAQKAVQELLRQGVSESAMRLAMESYAAYLRRTGKIKSVYVKTMGRFFGADGSWKDYAIVRADGQTRAQWAQSGKDVLEFDRLTARP